MLSGQVGDAADWDLTADSGAWSVVWASYSAQRGARTVAASQVRRPARTAASTPQRLHSDLQASAAEQLQRLLIVDAALLMPSGAHMARPQQQWENWESFPSECKYIVRPTWQTPGEVRLTARVMGSLPAQGCLCRCSRRKGASMTGPAQRSGDHVRGLHVVQIAKPATMAGPSHRKLCLGFLSSRQPRLRCPLWIIAGKFRRRPPDTRTLQDIPVCHIVVETAYDRRSL